MTLREAYAVLGLEYPIDRNSKYYMGDARRSGRTTHIAIEIALDMLQDRHGKFYIISPNANYRHLKNEVRSILTKFLEHLDLPLILPKTHLLLPETVERDRVTRHVRIERGIQKRNRVSTGFTYIYSDPTEDYLVGAKRFARLFFTLGEEEEFSRVQDRDGHTLYDCPTDQLMRDIERHTLCVDDVRTPTRWWDFESYWER